MVEANSLDPTHDPQAQSAWETYKQSRSSQARDALIVHYVPLVKYVAGRVAVGLPANVDYDDLVSFGIFGLLDAIEKFDEARGVKFETYAITRIRGAIIDGLRSLDWVPRSVRQKAREVEDVIASLEARLGRAATDEEVSQALGMKLEEYHRLLSEMSGLSVTSLDEMWSADPDEEPKLPLSRRVEDRSGDDPTQPIEESEVKRLLMEAIDHLPERERLVIALYYYEELTLKEIGLVLDVSESRISQIHTKAIMRLRSRLNRLRESLVP